MFEKTLRQTTWQIGPNTVGISMIAPLQYLLITLKVVALEKSLLVIQKILGLFVNRLTVDEKHYLPAVDNLTQTIHIK